MKRRPDLSALILGVLLLPVAAAVVLLGLGVALPWHRIAPAAPLVLVVAGVLAILVHRRS